LVEAFGPEFLITVEPLVGFFHRLGAQLAGDNAAGLVARHQAGIRQHVEMFHHRGQRHLERPGEVADRDGVGLAQPRQQRTPRRIGECRECAVKRRGQIVNHKVKYRRAGRRVKGAFSPRQISFRRLNDRVDKIGDDGSDPDFVQLRGRQRERHRLWLQQGG
jgi:hypothetical protein